MSLCPKTRVGANHVFASYNNQEKKLRSIAIYSSIISLIALSIIPFTLSADTISPRHQGKIVGGTISSEDAWPWMIGLVEDHDSGPLCGAALIHPRWVITAAHCMETEDGTFFPPEYYQAVSGVVDFTKSYDSHMHSIKRIVIHPNYDSYNIDNDIALLELHSDITDISPLDIYTGILSNLTGTVLGWGDTTGKNDYSDQLREVDLPVVSFQTCKDSSEYLVTDNMFCAGYPEGQKDACQGDSGGPFVIYDNHHWQLAGIVSWGVGCADPGYYGFFTRVPNYYSFISTYVPLQESFAHEDINHDGQTDLKDVMILFDHISKDNSKIK